MNRPLATSFRPENLGPNALRMIGNLCFAVFVLCVLLFTLLAATYRPDDPLLHPSTSFLLSHSHSHSTFVPDDSSALRTGEDFLISSAAADTIHSINISDINTNQEPNQETEVTSSANPDCTASPEDPIDCKLPEVCHLMMRSAIEKFWDIHFYRFGKPSAGSVGDGRTCDLAWRFRPKDAKRAGFYKDYRRLRDRQIPQLHLLRRRHRRLPHRRQRAQAQEGQEALLLLLLVASCARWARRST